MTWRRAAGVVALLLIYAGAFETFYLKIFTLDRARFGAQMADRQYRQTPGLRLFLNGVRERTPEGSTILLVTPFRKWWHGYEYAISRAYYPLSGRTVLPLIDSRDRLLTTNIERAEYVAAWHSNPAIAGFAEVWRDQHGVLLQRLR